MAVTKRPVQSLRQNLSHHNRWCPSRVGKPPLWSSETSSPFRFPDYKSNHRKMLKVLLTNKLHQCSLQLLRAGPALTPWALSSGRWHGLRFGVRVRSHAHSPPFLSNAAVTNSVVSDHFPDSLLPVLHAFQTPTHSRGIADMVLSSQRRFVFCFFVFGIKTF